VDAVEKLLLMVKTGVGLPLLVIVQEMSSAARMVKLTGMLVRPDTLVPVALLFTQFTDCA
jgi:hypothetical protein